MAQTFFQQFFRGPPKVPKRVKDILQIESKQPKHWSKRRWQRTPPKYVKGVSNGNYFRIKIPPKKKLLPNVPKLPNPTPMPKPLTPPPVPIKVTPENPFSYERYTRRLLGWLKSNRAVLVLNFGSICTLTGFMRSDVLELRSLALTGNVMFVLYVLQQNPILWASIGWSSLFASVNAWKIVEILHERIAEVHMSEEEQEVFVTHFMSHGVTPKQYERIVKKARKLKFKEGNVLVRSGEKLDHVYLITSGDTRALILGRFVTAASTNPDTRGDQKAGGDSGAWVGEMAFLDHLWEQEQRNAPDQSDEKTAGYKGSKNVVGTAIYTIVCDEDCTVLTWSHEEMAELVGSSTDLRSALTRAMTSALVGKVVNLTVSRTQKGVPRWSKWLSDWTNNDGAQVHLRSVTTPRLNEDKNGGSDTGSPAAA